MHNSSPIVPMLVCLMIAVLMLKAFLLDAPLVAAEKSGQKKIKAGSR